MTGLSLGAAGIAGDAPCAPVIHSVASADFTIQHVDGREVSISVWAPEQPGQYPKLIFSHGAFSAPDRYAALLEPMAAAGLIVMAPLHIDSEVHGHDKPPEHAVTWAARKADLIVLLNSQATPPVLEPGVQVAPLAPIAAGHSYGAFGAQVAAGAVAVGDSPYDSGDVAAVIALSPPGPLPGFIAPSAWDRMAGPQLVLTGTADVLPGFLDNWTLHTVSHRKALGSDQWLWVGAAVDHYFGNLIGRLDRDVAAQQTQFDDALHTITQFLVRYAALKAPHCASPIAARDTAIATLTNRGE